MMTCGENTLRLGTNVLGDPLLTYGDDSVEPGEIVDLDTRIMADETLELEARLQELLDELTSFEETPHPMGSFDPTIDKLLQYMANVFQWIEDNRKVWPVELKHLDTPPAPEYSTAIPMASTIQILDTVFRLQTVALRWALILQKKSNEIGKQISMVIPWTPLKSSTR